MMTNGWQVAKIGEVAKPIERAEEPQAGTIYRQVGVRLWGQGAYERESIDGSETKYKTLSRIESGDIIVNKIWARNGSVAVVTNELAGCFGSGEFPTFEPDQNKLEPKWFHWMTKTRWFWDACDVKSQGTSGKNRIRPEKFLDIEIPLPPLTEQRRIVAHIESLAARVNEAQSLREEADTEADILINSYLNKSVSDLVQKYKAVFLEELLTDSNYGTSVKCHSERTNDATPVLRIPNVASEKVTLDDLKYGVLSEAEFNKTVLSEGDILVVRTNGSKDLVGRCAVVPELPEPMAFASYMIRIRCNRDIISPEFLQLVLRQQRTGGFLIDLLELLLVNTMSVLED